MSVASCSCDLYSKQISASLTRNQIYSPHNREILFNVFAVYMKKDMRLTCEKCCHELKLETLSYALSLLIEKMVI